MFPTGSFDQMINELYNREYEKCTNIPITVGILLADYRRQFCVENIYNQLDRFNKHSGKLIDFYIPGWCNSNNIDPHYQDLYSTTLKDYAFSPQLYDEFIDSLENLGIEISGFAQLILLPYIKHKLITDEVLVFDIENTANGSSGISPKQLFDKIFDVASRETNFNNFEREFYENPSTAIWKKFFDGLRVEAINEATQKGKTVLKDICATCVGK